MKKIPLLRSMAIMMTAMAIVSCNDDDNKNSIDGCDRQECDLLQQIGQSLVLDYEGNPTSWKGVSWTLPIPSTGTRYVRGLTIDSKAMRPLPESIGELYFLKRLEVIGNVTGELPESMCQHGNVDTLIVSNTDMPGLGKDAFHSNMKYVSVRGNYKMGTLPASVTTLKGITEPASFNLSGNGFYGYIPAFEGVNIDLSNNQFSMVDFANAFNATQSTKESGKKEVYGVHMAGNNFSHLVIPDNVLSDTLALIHLAVLNQPIDYSKTFSNMPSQAELKSLAEKYYSNHPDLADLSSLFD